MSDLRGTLEQIRRRLNEFINAAHPRPGEWVRLSNLTDDSGNPPESIKDNLVLVVANIQKETTVSTYNSATPIRSDSFAIVSPPLYIDLFVLLYANFSEQTYPEGLAIIGRAISFFQQNLWFTHSTLPGLDPAIDRLTFELTNLDLVELNLLFGMMGAHYLPSVYYKVRMFPFQSGAVQAEVPAAQGVGNPADVLDPPPLPEDE
jgi:hypothetical protein